MYLFLANKQDLPNAMTIDEISELLDLPNMMKNNEWNIQPCCALTVMDYIRFRLVGSNINIKN